MKLIPIGLGHCHGYRVGPPTHFSVLVWRWSDLSLTLASPHAGLEVSDRCGFRHWEYSYCVYQWISQRFHPGCQHHDYPTCSWSIEVTCDKYLASYVSDQVRQISGGEVVVVWDVDRKTIDGCTIQSHLDCYSLELRQWSYKIVSETA